MSDDTLKDAEGFIYKKNWAGKYEPQWDFWNQRPARGPTDNLEYQPSENALVTEKPLFKERSTPTISTESTGDDVAAFLAYLALIFVVTILVALITLVGQLLASLLAAWRQLEQRYPRATLVAKLTFSMIAVGLGLAAAGFDIRIQLAGSALVLGLWGWLWLTRKLPLVFLPINALFAGIVLWLAAEATKVYWIPTWSRFSAGLPLLGNLSVVLAILPMVFMCLFVGLRRWPRIFMPVNLLAIGAVIWFVFMRVWTTWIPLWTQWTAPIQQMPPTGWLIFLAPMLFWMWRQGQARWPLPFFAGNLLLFGVLLSLTAYHTQPAWIETWRRWTVDLPFAGTPIAVIGLTPITLWGWNWVSRHWPRIFVLPNLLITGAILWLILDRTRSLWTPIWHGLWGEVPLVIDPAILVLVTPFAVWVWRQSGKRWPRLGTALQAILLGAILWWIAERTRSAWEDRWRSLAGGDVADLALLSGLTPLLLWSWSQLRRRWARVTTAIGLVAISLSLGWVTSRLLPHSTFVLRSIVAAIPFIVWGWSYLWRRHPRLGCVITLFPLITLGILAWLLQGQAQMFILAFLQWLAKQGVPLSGSGS